MVRFTKIIGALCLISLGSSQRQPSNEPLKRPYSISFYSSFDNTIENTGVELQLDEVAVETNALFFNFNKTRNWLFKLDVEYRNGALELVDFNLERDIQSLTFPFLWVSKPVGNSDWSPLLYVQPRFAGEELNFDSKQLFLSGLIGAKKRYSDRLEITAGLLYLETTGEPRVFPGIAVKYKINDDWLLDWQGPKLKLLKENDQFTWGVALEQNRKIWHFKDIQQEVSFSQLQLSALLFVDLSENSSLKFSLGRSLSGEFEVFDDRSRVSDTDIEGGYFINTQYTVKF